MRKLNFGASSIGFALAMAFSGGFAATVVFPEQAWAQNIPDDRRLGSRPGKAISRADQEAEQKVSLSADKIIEVLRREPGLLLEVKKALVRRAYEQGRILDSADLTDEALFRLLREDESVCILATREIEDRYYVRAKPTREELEEQRSSAAEQGMVRTAPANAASSDRVPSGPAKAFPVRKTATGTIMNVITAPPVRGRNPTKLIRPIRPLAPLPPLSLQIRGRTIRRVP